MMTPLAVYVPVLPEVKRGNPHTRFGVLATIDLVFVKANSETRVEYLATLDTSCAVMLPYAWDYPNVGEFLRDHKLNARNFQKHWGETVQFLLDYVEGERGSPFKKGLSVETMEHPAIDLFQRAEEPTDKLKRAIAVAIQSEAVENIEKISGYKPSSELSDALTNLVHAAVYGDTQGVTLLWPAVITLERKEGRAARKLKLVKR